jgi:hypothetical protein
MASYGMLRSVALVRTDVSEERSSSESSVLTRGTRRNIPADAIHHEFYLRTQIFGDKNLSPFSGGSYLAGSSGPETCTRSIDWEQLSYSN